MIYIEAGLIAIMMVLFVNVSISDIKLGIISNKSILAALTIGSIGDIIYYTLFARDCFFSFIVNIIAGSCISILLYALGVWGAGDTKLLMTTILLFPARLYCLKNQSLASCFLMIAMIFIIAFIYLIFDTIYNGIRQKNLFQFQKNNIAVEEYLKGILFYFFFLSILNTIAYMILPDSLLTDRILMTTIHFIFVLVGLKVEENSGWKTVIVLGIGFVISIFLRKSSFDFSEIQWWIYPVVLILVLFRTASNKYNYISINVSELKPGMILSVGSVLNFSKSKVKGLPKSTSEDLKSRLSLNEVESINRWAKTKNGRDTITIVRKIPFALFISVGSILFLVWEVLSQ